MNQQVSNTKNSIAEYTGRIQGAWHRAAESIIEVGRLLAQAEVELGTAGFRKLRRVLEDSGTMSNSTISKLIGIAGNQILTSEDRLPLLPPSYETLYNLSRWEPDKLKMAFDSGIVRPQMQQKETRQQQTVADETSPGSKQKLKTLFQVQSSGRRMKPKTRQELQSLIEKLDGLDGISVVKRSEF